MTDLELPAGVAEQLRWDECDVCGEAGPHRGIGHSTLVLPQWVVAQEELTVRNTDEGNYPCSHDSHMPAYACDECCPPDDVPFLEGNVRLTTAGVTPTQDVRLYFKHVLKQPYNSTVTLADCVGVKQYDRDHISWDAHQRGIWEGNIVGGQYAGERGLVLPRADFDALLPGPKVLLIMEPT